MQDYGYMHVQPKIELGHVHLGLQFYQLIHAAACIIEF